MASLVMAIGVTLLLRHAAAIVRFRSTIELDWVPLTWMVLQFVGITWVWWSLWDFAAVKWTYPWFFYLLSGPTLQFIAISLLVSTDVSKSGASLAENFVLIRMPFFLLLAVFQVLVSWDGWIFGVEPFWNSLRSLQLLILITYVIAAISQNRFVQKCAVITMAGLYIFGLFFLRYLPGAFAAP